MDEEQKKQINEKEIDPKAAPGKWASCFRIFDPVGLKTLSLREIENNEAAISCYITTFANQQSKDSQRKKYFLLIGTVKDFIPGLGKLSAAFIYTYRLSPYDHNIELLHKTKLEGIPLCYCSFKG